MSTLRELTITSSYSALRKSLLLAAVVTLSCVAHAQTVYVAANGVLQGTARVENCSACQSGTKVDGIGLGPANTVTITANVSAAGAYRMTISYETAKPRTLYVTINGSVAAIIPTNGNSFQIPQTLTINVTLRAGSNSIAFGNPNTTQHAPYVDQITIQ